MIPAIVTTLLNTDKFLLTLYRTARRHAVQSLFERRVLWQISRFGPSSADTASWKVPRWFRQFAQPLRFDERGQPSAAALAKLAGAQRVRHGFQVGDAVDVEVRHLGVGRKQMQRTLSHQPHAERFAQLG